jgi:spore maturation protein SpmA
MDIALPLAGVMTLWLGIMNIGEKAGAIGWLAKIISPFFSRIFPEVPKDHPATGHMVMNFSANLLGLDNAATPFGLKAMESLQTLNPNKDTASNAQIMFLVLHTSGLTLIPLAIMAQRAILGAADPSDIFIPCMIATYVATVAGIIAVSIRQRINLFDGVLLSWLGGMTAAIGLMMWYFTQYLSKAEIETVSKVASNLILFSIIVVFIVGALRKGVNVYEAFIEGAKGGIQTSLTIIPYLVGMLVAISVIRNSGVLGFVVHGLEWVFAKMGLDTEFHAGPADRADEAAVRQRLARADDRHHEDLRRGLLRRPPGLHLPGLGRHHLLYRRPVLRLGGRAQDPLRHFLRPDRRPGRRHRRHFRGLCVLRISFCHDKDPHATTLRYSPSPSPGCLAAGPGPAARTGRRACCARRPFPRTRSACWCCAATRPSWRTWPTVPCSRPRP